MKCWWNTTWNGWRSCRHRTTCCRAQEGRYIIKIQEKLRVFCSDNTAVGLPRATRLLFRVRRRGNKGSLQHETRCTGIPHIWTRIYGAKPAFPVGGVEGVDLFQHTRTTFSSERFCRARRAIFFSNNVCGVIDCTTACRARAWRVRCLQPCIEVTALMLPLKAPCAQPVVTVGRIPSAVNSTSSSQFRYAFAVSTAHDHPPIAVIYLTRNIE